MKVVITGGCGFIGQRLVLRLLEKGELAGPDGVKEIEKVTLADLLHNTHLHPALEDKVEIIHLDIRDVSMDPFLTQADVIFHLSSVLSSEGEEDFNKAMWVNLDGTRGLLEAMRANSIKQRLVFASTTAVFGNLAEQSVGDFTKHEPLTTYGTTKSMCELMINDYSRKGFVDGRCPRLPTVIVRDRSSHAASSFCSDVIRDPLQGRDAVLPVPREQPMPVTSYLGAVDGLIAVCELEEKALGESRAICLPALNVTAGDLVDAVEKFRGSRSNMGKVVEKINPAVAEICANWPGVVDSSRAEGLGLPKPGSLGEIIATYISDYIDTKHVG